MRGEVAWSDEVYRIHGVGREHVPTLDGAIDAYHPDDRERVAGLVERAVEAGTPFAFAGALLRPGGNMNESSI